MKHVMYRARLDAEEFSEIDNNGQNEWPENGSNSEEGPVVEAVAPLEEELVQQWAEMAIDGQQREENAEVYDTILFWYRI